MRCLIVNHDAGGAEIVSSWVRRNPQNQYQFVLEGPAFQIYQRKLQNVNNIRIDDLHALLQKTDLVLTGTSASANLERAVIKNARRAGKPTTSFLDYWHGFKERFILDGELCLPDELWVGDRYALDIVNNIFTGIKIRYVENPYLLDIKNEAQEKRLASIKNSIKEKIDILYLCQPFDYDHTTASGKTTRITDVEMLQYFFQDLCDHRQKVSVNSVKIRLHPTESENKYSSCIKNYEGIMPISFAKKLPLVDECLSADFVVGTHTMGLVVALVCDAKVFHCIPPGYYPCALPYQEIGDFHAFLESR